VLYVPIESGLSFTHMLDSAQRTRVWFTVALCLLLIIAGYFFAEWLLPTSEPLHPTASDDFPVPTLAPVVAPTIKDANDIAQYTEDKPLPVKPDPTVFLRDEGQNHLLRGSADAPVSLVEYANFSGSYGRVMHGILQKLFEANAATMNWKFRHYPASNNALDLVAGQGVECLVQQLGEDTGWRYIDRLYAQELTEALVYSIAGDLGVDAEKFRTCIEKKELMDIVLKDKFYAQADAKIFVVPSSVFINNRVSNMRVVEGLNTLEYMQAVLVDVSK